MTPRALTICFMSLIAAPLLVLLCLSLLDTFSAFAPVWIGDVVAALLEIFSEAVAAFLGFLSGAAVSMRSKT